MGYVDIKRLEKDELIILYLKLKQDNKELRSRINKIISEEKRKEYLRGYSKEYRKRMKKNA